MSRTERTRLMFARIAPEVVGSDYAMSVDRDGRDVHCGAKCCKWWKRPARRTERHRAKDALRRNPEIAA